MGEDVGEGGLGEGGGHGPVFPKELADKEGGGRAGTRELHRPRPHSSDPGVLAHIRGFL